MGVSRAPGLSWGGILGHCAQHTQRSFKKRRKKSQSGTDSCTCSPCGFSVLWPHATAQDLLTWLHYTGFLLLFYHAALRFFLPPLTLPFPFFSLASLSLSSAGEAGGAGEALGRRISAGLCERHFLVAPMLACCQCPFLAQTYPTPLKFFNGIKL